MESQVLTVQNVQIERTIRSGPSYVSASFRYGATDLVNALVITKPKGLPAQFSVMFFSTMTVELAGAMAVALQMAIDWTVEELQRQEGFGSNGDATTPGLLRA